MKTTRTSVPLPAVSQPEAKRRRLMDRKDVTVVVGGKEFLENSRHLRAFCGCFEEALRQQGGSNEPPTIIEFPDRDPDEWEEVREFLAPFSRAEITQANAYVVATWCHELRVVSASPLRRCDRILSEAVRNHASVLLASKRTPYYRKGGVGWMAGRYPAAKILEALALAVDCLDLEATKASAMQAVVEIFATVPFVWDAKDLQVIGMLMASDKECQQEWWCCDEITRFLPEDLTEAECSVLCTTGIFAKVVRAGIDAAEKYENYNANDTEER